MGIFTKYLLIHLFLLSTVAPFCAMAQFTGGVGGGDADSSITNTTCSLAGQNPFAGGNNDGHASVRVINTTCAPSDQNPFAGGNDDGHASVRVINTTCAPSGQNPFGGGGADGHSNFALVISQVDCDALPITLLYFNAQARDNVVYLNWATSTEVNNDFFTIEKSKYGSDWQEISTVDGAGFSNRLLKYSYLDSEPYPGLSYYRLKQTDFDGRFEYSDVRAVNFESQGVIAKIYPNPAKEKFNIFTWYEDDYQVNVTDATGKTVWAEKNSKEINSHDFASGMYLVKITFKDGKTSMLKVMIIK
jgi:hypothetical protein